MEESPHNIILMAPIGISLLLNLIFLINIVRVLVTKLRANNSPDTHQTRKAVRATLILIPLLGLHYMLTPFRPEAKSEWEVIYEIIAAVCTSFQGLCVALLFCLFNAEVIAVIRKRLKDSFVLNRQSRKQAAHQARPKARSGSALAALRLLFGAAKPARRQQQAGAAAQADQRRSSKQIELLAKAPNCDSSTMQRARTTSSSNASSLLTTLTASPVQQHVALHVGDDEPQVAAAAAASRPLLQTSANELAEGADARQFRV